ncbi:MAG: hypothetical protein AAGD32_03530 [Planctomycetota bacterium]
MRVTTTHVLTLLATLFVFPAFALARDRFSPLDRALARVERAERDVYDAKLSLRDATSLFDNIAVQLREAQRFGGRLDGLRNDLIRAERDLIEAEQAVAIYTQEVRSLDRLLHEQRAFRARCVDRYANEREVARLRYELDHIESDLRRGHGYGFNRADLIRRADRVRFELRVRTDSERNIIADLRRAQDTLLDAERAAERFRCDVRDLRAAIAECDRYDLRGLRRDYALAEQRVDDARCHLDRAESNYALAVRDYERIEREYALAHRDDREADRFYGRDRGGRGYENGRRPRERYRR